MTANRWILALASMVFASATAADEGERAKSCSVTASLDYFQRGAEAEVETTIENDDCGASRGSYVIEAAIRADGAQGPEKLTFPETWERNDDQAVIITKRYPIGNDVDLLRVKIRKLKCTCDAAE